jgi:glycosyltransferase involved in cell wall biosynthesis
VIQHDCSSNHDLASLSSSHDVGLALEGVDLPSRNLTATNKIFEYLRCGLGVIATETKGQEEVMQKAPGAGWMVKSGEVASLHRVIQRLLDDPSAVRLAKDRAREAGAGPWAWESHSPKLAAALTGSLGLKG